jgi:hypothetical protein
LARHKVLDNKSYVTGHKLSFVPEFGVILKFMRNTLHVIRNKIGRGQQELQGLRFDGSAPLAEVAGIKSLQSVEEILSRNILGPAL